ncbi:MAG: hypothetical protein DRR08_06615 [Candidatus Parabeggiatoa sp. nov. 2]|nr:MAG: hypothetical protein B6247_01045 [Beggiatoa sp. 4572_84]RKZ62253.1 MAG: hypothetical protein DRR08_06615 [Gammaproteobacteria bacterium]
MGHVNQPVLKVILKALKEENSYTRKCAVQALGELATPEVVEPLIKALEDKEPEIRGLAADALGKNPATVMPLIHLLEDAYIGVAVKAAQALGKMEDKQAVEALMHYQQHGHPVLQKVIYGVSHLSTDFELSCRS